MKTKICCVCKTYGKKNLSPFPKDPVLRNAWVVNTGITPATHETTAMLCSIHFDSDQWTYRKCEKGDQIEAFTRVLKKDAIPTLYLMGLAPAFDAEIAVPQLDPKLKKSRCAVCYLPMHLDRGAFAIFDQDDNYTEFGAALSKILSLTSRRLFTRYACTICAGNVLNCFDNMVAINVSTVLSNRKFEIIAKDKELKSNVDSPKKDDSSTDYRRVFSEKCFKCEDVLLTKQLFTDHLLKHFLENRDVVRKCVAVTQTGTDPVPVMPVMEYNQLPLQCKLEQADDVADVIRELEIENGPADVLQLQAMTDVDTNMQDAWVNYDEIETIETLEEEEVQPVAKVRRKTRKKPVGGVVDEDFPETKMKAKRISKPYRSLNVKEGGICHLCGQWYKTSNSLAAHISLHKDNEEGQRKCHLCNTSLKNSTSLKKHMQLVHNKPRNHFKACDLCGKLRGNLYQHRKNCSQTLANALRPVKRKCVRSTCGVCGKSVYAIYLAKHLQLHEIEEDVAQNGPEALEKYYTPCSICGKKVKNISLHLKVIHGVRDLEIKPQVLECAHCDRTFIHRPMLVIHLVLKHNMDPRELTHEKHRSWKSNWTCSVCQKSFASYKTIRTHTKVEHEGVGINAACEECGKRYNTIEALREHINVKHVTYFSYQCEYCDRNLATEVGLQEHKAMFCRALPLKRKVQELTLNSLGDDPLSTISLTDTDVVTYNNATKEGPPVEFYDYIPNDETVVFYVDV